MAIRSIADDFAPYTSINAMRTVFERCRAGKLPDPLTEQALQQIGVNPSMVSPTLRTVLFMGLIDEGGNATAAFTQIKRASSEEYPGALADLVRRAYIKVFQVADPADGEERITNAFRGFEPSNQREKMIRLFMGLCEDAGIVAAGTTRKRSSTPGQRIQSVSRTRQAVATNGTAESATLMHPQPPQSQSGSTTSGLKGKEITLLTGDGRVHLAVYYDPFTISDDDLDFVRGLIKQLTSYEAKASPPVVPTWLSPAPTSMAIGE